MKKIILALVAGLTFAHGAFAAEVAPASAAAVRELLDAMNYRTAWKASMEQIIKTMPNIMRQQAEAGLRADTSLTDAQRKEKQAKLDADLPKMSAVLAGVFNDPALMADMEKEMIALYSRHFTPDELKQIAAYYRTPVGAKSMRLMPQVMAESMAIGQRITLPRIQKAMEQFQNK
ncbi:MAG: hypothetical protein K0R43_4283 [Pseudoduganella sp.]|jgi:hypothetical protein|nr:hypothetical protein [Pseudoduganella sp.]